MKLRIVEIKFPDTDMIETANLGGIKARRGDYIILNTKNGPRWAEVIDSTFEIEIKDELVKSLPVVDHVADEKEVRRIEALIIKSGEAKEICVQKVGNHKLPMKIIGVDMAMDGSKITFHFTAENRVDFRELVKDLASVFRTRIELHQVGVRDEARIFGGIGPCGVRLCCTSFIREFQPVSIKMAKEQNLPLNPMKISGLCGRLLCCLRYEHKNYVECKKGLPKPNQVIPTPQGPARVVHINVLARRVTVEGEDGTRWDVDCDDAEGRT